MNLDDAQRKNVTEWIAQGLKLSDIQNRLASEFGLRLTYMDVRLLVDDLKLVPKDVERVSTGAGTIQAPGGATPPAAKPLTPQPAAPIPPRGAGQVSVTVDQLARPGAIVSGKVTFSDGQKAEWYLDQAGRLGVVPSQPGYKPPAADVQQFQVALDSELAKMGF
jgi:hypothetical protein